MPGFIVLEGADAVGKATQTAALTSYLNKKGQSAASCSFPNYDSNTGRIIKEHLEKKWRAERVEKEKPDHFLNEMIFQSLMTMNRYERVPWMRNALKNSILICDRYWFSGYVYGVANGLSPQWLIDIHQELPQPDLVFVLTTPPEVAWKRRPERRDRYEADKELMEKVYRGYLDLAEDLSGKFPGVRWAVLDSSGSKEQTFKKMTDVLETALETITLSL